MAYWSGKRRVVLVMMFTRGVPAAVWMCLLFMTEEKAFKKLSLMSPHLMLDSIGMKFKY